MSDILSQNEIDALLSALSTGEVKAEEIKSKELDKKVKPYDFKRPNKFSKEQLHTLSMIHENFARLLTTYLSAQLRTVVQINVFFVEQMTYNEFIFSIPNPSLIAVVDFSPLKGAAIMEINPSIAFSIIDRLLGGPGEYSGKLREPTEIETGIIEKVFSKMTRILSDAWKDIADIQTTLEKLETNSQFVQLVSPNEAVALITFNAKVGNSDGMINICIPHIVLEPIIPKLSTRIWLSTSKQEQAETTKQFITEKVYDTKAEIRAELGRTLITVGEFINLATGDVIALNRNIEDGADIFIKDKLKFSGSIGVHRNKMAIKIQKKFGEGGEFNG
ncbi:flagellar motor switch protein FliM [Tepidanaerobacter acetatoxydans]|uniref:flagellar motor switch protein FliM n=1 Tax=Tepidanaerobacter acetatoxydans TaxID=499229 RepID=UPI001BD4A11D|nr:flagellar motor switch protein FliM [Tepidanaerobacter acetatoxydans]